MFFFESDNSMLLLYLTKLAADIFNTSFILEQANLSVFGQMCLYYANFAPSCAAKLLFVKENH